MKIDIPEFCILIDSREQKKYTFENINPNPKTKIVGLKSGDYSLEGFTELVAIERKTLADAFQSVGKNRIRFEKEMQRMSKFEYAALVVEAEIKQWFLNPPTRSKMSSKAVFRSIIAFSVRYNISVWPCWDRSSAEKTTYLILKRFFDDYTTGNHKDDKESSPKT